jgi:hypothetical protein
MNDEWEQFPPIEGNPSTALESTAVILTAIFAIAMVVYVLVL